MIKLFHRKKIITDKEKKLILNWVKNNENVFLPNAVGPYRKRFRFDQTDIDISYLLIDIKNRIIKQEKIKNYIQDPILGDYIGHISNKGFIQKHTDPTIFGFSHIRYNLFLSLPQKGGRPIYNNKIIKVSENEYIKCNSSNEFHECEVVIGEKPRIMVSYGFLIPN